MGFGLGPPDEAAGIAAIGEDARDEGIAPARGLERQLAAVAVLNVRAIDPDAEQPAIGVGQDVPLASGDLLARIIAFRPPF